MLTRKLGLELDSDIGGLGDRAGEQGAIDRECPLRSVLFPHRKRAKGPGGFIQRYR
jgi:hypothetical protein